jgi:hypothetical protein
MFGLKRPTRIDLRSNDAAIVVRENGEMEMFIRQAKGDEELPPGQVVLALFGVSRPRYFNLGLSQNWT